jgi:redox-sensing transcriptional repressor
MGSNDDSVRGVPKPVLTRMPAYLNYLRARQKEGVAQISSTRISQDMNLNHVQVRKDLAMISDSGRPKTGFAVDELVRDISVFLGYTNTKDAVLAGAGQLGKTLLRYGGFANYGLNIAAAFDVNPELFHTRVNDKEIYPMEKMPEVVQRLGINIGVITVPAQAAQDVCDLMVKSGIRAIWNFAPTHLKAPEKIIIQDENIATSLAVLSCRLDEAMSRERNKDG